MHAVLICFINSQAIVHACMTDLSTPFMVITEVVVVMATFTFQYTVSETVQ